MERIVQSLNSAPDNSSFIRLDVRDFFPSVLHSKLAIELKKAGAGDLVKAICLKAVRTPTGTAAFMNERGIPQGLSISNALSQIYLNSFDALQIARGTPYFRYVDDILCIAPHDEARETLSRITRNLNGRGLKVHPLGKSGKTEIRAIKAGVDFLGYHITPTKVSVRKSSYDKMFRNLLKVITDFRYRKDVQRTLYRLNLKISGCKVDGKRRGWMMFFARTDDKSQLKLLDMFVKQQLNRVNFPSYAQNELKTFIKSYHEIRFNLDKSSYIPDLDNFTQEQKIDAICNLSGRKPEEVASWNIQVIEREFGKLISKEIMEMEQDIGSIS